ncbi:hypothetical protein YC2023_059645 [Brassica napus]
MLQTSPRLEAILTVTVHFAAISDIIKAKIAPNESLLRTNHKKIREAIKEFFGLILKTGLRSNKPKYPITTKNMTKVYCGWFFPLSFKSSFFLYEVM